MFSPCSLICFELKKCAKNSVFFFRTNICYFFVKEYCNKRDLFLTPQTVYQCPAGLLNITSSSNCLATCCTFPNSNHAVPWFYALLRILYSIRKKAEELR